MIAMKEGTFMLLEAVTLGVLGVLGVKGVKYAVENPEEAGDKLAEASKRMADSIQKTAERRWENGEIDDQEYIEKFGKAEELRIQAEEYLIKKNK